MWTWVADNWLHVPAQTEMVELWYPARRPNDDVSTEGWDWMPHPHSMKHGISVRQRIGPSDTLPFHCDWGHGSHRQIDWIPNDKLWIELKTSRKAYRIDGRAIKDAINDAAGLEAKS